VRGTRSIATSRSASESSTALTIAGTGEMIPLSPTRGDARHAQSRLDDHVRLGEPPGDVADGPGGRARDVVGPFVEGPRRAFRERGLDRRDRQQHRVANVQHLGASAAR